MKITDLFSSRKSVLTSEVGPVKGSFRPGGGGSLPKCVDEALSINDYIDAVNVTDNQSAVMRLGSLPASIRLKEQGIEPIYQITCRDRNRIALQSDLLTAYSLGIDNILALTGDYTSLGDHKSAKPVFDLDSVQLIKVADGLKKGHDMMGNELTQAPDFAIGAVVNPNFEPLELQLMKMEKKIEAGAEFFQTQAIYDQKVFERFIKAASSFGVPIQLGVVLVKSAKMANFMNDNVSGISVPSSWIQEYEKAGSGKARDVCLRLTSELVKDLAPMCQGVHFMPLGWTSMLPGIIQQSGLVRA